MEDKEIIDNIDKLLKKRNYKDLEAAIAAIYKAGYKKALQDVIAQAKKNGNVNIKLLQQQRNQITL